ncbi:hypothetical protein GQ53DRAFT_583358, partial [Thozetella sp. PMI_491]
CRCVEDATRAWKCTESMTEASLDVIIIASAQTVDFSLKLPECQAHVHDLSANVNDILLHILSNLVDLLRSAIITNSSAVPACLGHSASRPASLCPTLSSHRRTMPPNLQMYGYQRIDLQDGPKMALSEDCPACLQTPMSLGEYGLDEQQSQLLALELVCRTLKNFAHILREMVHRGVDEAGKVDERVISLLARVMRLISAGSTSL